MKTYMHRENLNQFLTLTCNNWLQEVKNNTIRMYWYVKVVMVTCTKIQPKYDMQQLLNKILIIRKSRYCTCTTKNKQVHVQLSFILSS